MNLLRRMPNQLHWEFTSRHTIGGWPLVKVVVGRSPKTGKIGTARGIIAVGQKAVGILAVGQTAMGLVAVGQTAAGLMAVGQVAVGLLAGVGQVATGMFAVGQLVLGMHGRAQFGLGPSTLRVLHGIRFPR